MSNSLKPYTNAIRSALARALCIQTFPSQTIERHNTPEIEFQDSPELILPPEIIERSEKEKCLIEASINSVRISLKLNKADLLEEELTKMYMRCVAWHGGAWHGMAWCIAWQSMMKHDVV